MLFSSDSRSIVILPKLQSSMGKGKDEILGVHFYKEAVKDQNIKNNFQMILLLV